MILLERRHIDHIEAAAERAYPEECCGLLIGSAMAAPAAGWRVSRVVDSANVAPSRRHQRFEVDPAVQIRLQRQLRGSGLSVIGVYHSHPDGEARPSAHDLAQADDPDLAWLITAVRQARRVETTAHVLDRGGAGFRPIDLCISEAPEPPPGAKKT